MICCTGPKIWAQEEGTKMIYVFITCKIYKYYTCFCTGDYLFFGDAHIIRDIWEDSGLDEESLLTPCGPPTLQRGTLIFPTFYQIHYLIKLLLVNLQIRAAHFHFVWRACREVNVKTDLKKVKSVKQINKVRLDLLHSVPVVLGQPPAVTDLLGFWILLFLHCGEQTPRKWVPQRKPWIQPDSTGPGWRTGHCGLAPLHTLLQVKNRNTWESEVWVTTGIFVSHDSYYSRPLIRHLHTSQL